MAAFSSPSPPCRHLSPSTLVRLCRCARESDDVKEQIALPTKKTEAGRRAVVSRCIRGPCPNRCAASLHRPVRRNSGLLSFVGPGATFSAARTGPLAERTASTRPSWSARLFAGVGLTLFHERGLRRTGKRLAVLSHRFSFTCGRSITLTVAFTLFYERGLGRPH